ncbi:SMP-30/gluconolactonase/LRE family protein [Dietzia cinnamea]|uniref:SMP-30/gluconolactonase/LRE family protein n=1 Tax=Dietzia cinnamea TaxID=321318 RepID=UPI0021A61BE1|nr:SMP-30/gluconolactonase/LRE family protein [Dietzia cinnamea]MCT1711952.1 SMP-30/gluconolactonase/LRE family protein [Dietzia cinnamea]
MGARRNLRAASVRAVSVGLAVVLAPAALVPAAAAAVPPGSVEGAAGSVGSAAVPIEDALGSVGPHGGSAAALDAGSGLVSAPGSVGTPGSVGAPIAPCPGPAPRVSTFGDAPVPVVGWTENLALDADGRLWVSKTFLNRVDAYDPDGRVVASVAVRAPGGIALGPDGRMHVAAGTGYLADRSDVVTFDPNAERPEARIEARLDARMNGLAVDAAGNRYLTSLETDRLTRVTAAGEVDDDWSRRAQVGVSNGIAIEGHTAYVTQSTTRTVVLEVPLDRPEATTTRELTTPPEIARGLDDLAVTPQALYVTSWTTGEVFRVDRGTGDACVLVGGIPRATAVVVADGFGEFGPDDLLVTSLHGPIRHVRLAEG